MKEELHKQSWEERLREAANKVEMEPSDAVWENVRRQLPGTSGKVYFYRWAAAAVFLILLGVGIYFWVSTEPTSGLHPSLSKNVNSGTGPALDSETVAGKTAPPAAGKQPLKPMNNKNSKNQVLSEKAPLASRKQVRTAPVVSQEAPIAVPSNIHLPVLSNISRYAGRDSAPVRKELSFRYSNKITRMLLQSAGFVTDQEADFPEKTTIDREDKKKLAFGLFFTPGLSYRTLKMTGTAGHPPVMDIPNAPAGGGYSLMSPMSTEATRMNLNEKPMQQSQSWGWESGIRVALDLSKGWMLQTGLSLRETNYNVVAYKGSPGYVNRSGNFMSTARPMANSNYALFVSRMQEDQTPENLQNKYLNTELPVLIGKRFGAPGKISFSVMAGAGITYLLNENAVMYAPKSRRYFQDEHYVSPVNGSLILETSLNVPMGNHFHFSVGPMLQYQISSSYKNYNSVKEFPYLIGVQTGIRFR